MESRKAAKRPRRQAHGRTPEPTKRIVLAISRRVVRVSLAELLAAVPTIRVCAAVTNGTATRVAVRQHSADAVILDLFSDDRLNDAAAMSLLADLPRLHVVLLGHGQGRSGATTTLGASETLDDLVRVIVRGPAPGSSTSQAGAAVPGVSQPLSRSERRVAALVAKGLPNRTIAVLLHLSERTVRNYVSSILAKLGYANRTQLATRIASGQLDVSEDA